MCLCSPVNTHTNFLKSLHIDPMASQWSPAHRLDSDNAPWEGAAISQASDSERIGASPLDNCDVRLEISSSNCQFTEAGIWDTTSQSRKNLKPFLKALKEKNILQIHWLQEAHFHHCLSPVSWPPPRKMNKLRCVCPRSAQTLRAA